MWATQDLTPQGRLSKQKKSGPSYDGSEQHLDPATSPLCRRLASNSSKSRHAAANTRASGPGHVGVGSWRNGTRHRRTPICLITCIPLLDLPKRLEGDVHRCTFQTSFLEGITNSIRLDQLLADPARGGPPIPNIPVSTCPVRSAELV